MPVRAPPPPGIRTSAPTATRCCSSKSIPTDQTRRFVKQVLADSWLYAEEIGLKPSSLDALAEGNFPRLNLNTDIASAN